MRDDQHNPNCDGSHCVYQSGQVRVLPYGGDGNLILCHSCYHHEIEWRKTRNISLGKGLQFMLPAWESLKVYGDNSGTGDAA